MSPGAGAWYPDQAFIKFRTLSRNALQVFGKYRTKRSIPSKTFPLQVHSFTLAKSYFPPGQWIFIGNEIWLQKSPRRSYKRSPELLHGYSIFRRIAPLGCPLESRLHVAFCASRRVVLNVDATFGRVCFPINLWICTGRPRQHLPQDPFL